MSVGDYPVPQFGPFDPILPMMPTGCICPPGANKECENPTCPRKPHGWANAQQENQP